MHGNKEYTIDDVTLKWLAWELLMTFSGQKGFFASKRIENFVTFSLATLMIVVYTILRFIGVLTLTSMPSTDIVLLSGTLYGYGGYNRIMMERESKSTTQSKESKDSTEPKQEVKEEEPK